MSGEDLDWQKLFDELKRPLIGPAPKELPPVTPGALDHILRNRTHVRVLRVLTALDQHINLSGRDVARRANASPGRVNEVLAELTSLGVLTSEWTPHHRIYRIRDEHELAGAIRALFSSERALLP
jgi:hypothetical protein